LDGEGGNDAKEHSFFSIEGLELALSCFKPAAVKNEFIVRVYEIEGKNGTAQLKFDKIIQSAKLVDLCEKEIGDLAFDDDKVLIPVEAHSIFTLKIRLHN
jgi:alpha-mannosidase